jgi:hypothetical protein
MLSSTKAFPLSDNSWHAVYCVRKHQFVAVAEDRASAETALKHCSPEYGPNLVVLSHDDAMACNEAAFRSEVAEITVDKWNDMLGVLPPMAWRHDGLGESFKLSEYLTGGITSIYVALERRFFTCCARVRDSAAFANPVRQPDSPPSSGMSLEDVGRLHRDIHK